jgi:hypothetical protein
LLQQLKVGYTLKTSEHVTDPRRSSITSSDGDVAVEDEKAGGKSGREGFKL